MSFGPSPFSLEQSSDRFNLADMCREHPGSNIIYVIGHKSPDCDSICSAIAYAYLQNQLKEKISKKAGKTINRCYIPARAGHCNEQTLMVLERFHFKQEDVKYLKDVFPCVDDALISVGNPDTMFYTDQTLNYLGDRMMKRRRLTIAEQSPSLEKPQSTPNKPSTPNSKGKGKGKRPSAVVTQTSPGLGSDDSPLSPKDALRFIEDPSQLMPIPIISRRTGQLKGAVTMNDLADKYLSELDMQDLSNAGVSFGYLIHVLKGELLTPITDGIISKAELAFAPSGQIEFDEPKADSTSPCSSPTANQIFGFSRPLEISRESDEMDILKCISIKGKVVIASDDTETMGVTEDDVVIVGNRVLAQLFAIQKNASCLIITNHKVTDGEKTKMSDSQGGYLIDGIDPRVLEEAKKRNVIIIATEFDTYKSARLINQSVPLSKIMTKVNCLTKGMSIFQAKKKIISGHDEQMRHIPVVDQNNKFLGIVLRDTLIDPSKYRKRIILVDHQELSQAVDGSDEAEIMEIVDHHRLGGIKTPLPIFTRNEAVGATATIVANMMMHRGVEILPNYAGLLLGAIISDTLLFQSPTCTQKDRDTAQELARIASIEDLSVFGTEVLNAGNITKKAGVTAKEIFLSDEKEYSLGDKRVAVSQITVSDFSEIEPRLDEVLKEMENLSKSTNWDDLVFVVTKFTDEAASRFYIHGKDDGLLSKYNKIVDGKRVYWEKKKVVSRKLQIIPDLIAAARTLDSDL